MSTLASSAVQVFERAAELLEVEGWRPRWDQPGRGLLTSEAIRQATVEVVGSDEAPCKRMWGIACRRFGVRALFEFDAGRTEAEVVEAMRMVAGSCR